MLHCRNKKSPPPFLAKTLNEGGVFSRAVIICVSRAFRSTDLEKRETARTLTQSKDAELESWSRPTSFPGASRLKINGTGGLLLRLTPAITMSRRTGNSCLLQSSWHFPCTRILPVVINTVIATNSSSEEAVSLSKLMTILSHFEAEWLLSCSFQITLYPEAFPVNRLWYLSAKVVIQCDSRHSDVVNPKHFAEGLYTDRSMDS